MTSSNTIFGFWVYLMTDCIMFATFFAAYAVLNDHAAAKQLLELRFALAETVVLLLSCFTCAHKKSFFGLGVTFLLGSVFIFLQATEFQHLITSGHTWQTSGFLSSFFALLGLHTLHVIAGLFIMAVFLVQLGLWGMNEMVHRRLTCLRIYWQFVYLIWIFTFAIVYLIGAK